MVYQKTARRPPEDCQKTTRRPLTVFWWSSNTMIQGNFYERLHFYMDSCAISPMASLLKYICQTFYLQLCCINLSKTTQKSHWKSETKFSPRQNPRIFFQQFFFLQNFVSDYIPKLYVVCNHLICMLITSALKA